MRYFLIISLFIFPLTYTADSSAAVVEGLYDTLNPERGRNGQPTQKVFMKMADMNGQSVVAVVGCNPGCVPVVYSYQKEPSETLGRDIYFSKAGIYLFAYDENSYVTAIPDAQLGMKEWSRLMFFNVYAKQGTTLPLDKAGAMAFAIDQSKKIMNTGTLVEQTRGSGTYHLASPVKVSGKSYQTATIELQEAPNKSLTFSACERCSADKFKFLSDESSLTGTETYMDSRGNVIFDVKDGVFVWAKFGRDFGKKEWGKRHYFNVYAKDIGYIRGIRNEKSKQDSVDALMAEYALTVKTEMDRRRKERNEKKVANQTLPKRGMQNAALESEITAAAQRWASTWNWKESIPYAYFTSADWRVKHHPLTGIVTGRHIRGIIVMKRQDGLCSFHYASFGQDYDGSQFVSTHMLGLTPGQIKLSCDKI